MEIKAERFMRKQPGFPKVDESDKFYYVLAQHLARLWDNSHRFINLSDDVRVDVVLNVIGYYQDVVADAGIWRSFTMLHQQMYGTTLPFYPRSDDYIDYELNLDDVRFIIWYTIEGESNENGLLSPFDKNIEFLAKLFFNTLDEVYEDAPTPAGYNDITSVDLDDEEDRERIYKLTFWLFWNSYFMPPAAKVAMNYAVKETHDIMHEHESESSTPMIRDLRDRYMVENPTGPLSLMIGDWVNLIVNGKVPKHKDGKGGNEEPHKFYKAFTQATGGKEIAFFDSYKALEDFLIEKMGWERNEGGIFPSMRDFKNFVILANHDKGILVAHDVAPYIAHPDNKLYDKELAAREAHQLITEYGRCPMDLVRYLFANGLVPDAVLPYDETRHVLHDNWDFLARLYQQGCYND
jgi:hypothetical protein